MEPYAPMLTALCRQIISFRGVRIRFRGGVDRRGVWRAAVAYRDGQDEIAVVGMQDRVMLPARRLTGDERAAVMRDMGFAGVG